MDKPGEEDSYLFQIKTQKMNACHSQFHRAKTAPDFVPVKLNASLAKKPLMGKEAPNLETESIFANTDKLAEVVHIDASPILAQQSKDPILAIYAHG